METGAVSFKNNKLITNLHVEKDKDILKVILKTKTEAQPDLKSKIRNIYKFQRGERSSYVKTWERKSGDEENGEKD